MIYETHMIFVQWKYWERDKERVLQLLKALLEALIWLCRCSAGTLTFEEHSHCTHYIGWIKEDRGCKEHQKDSIAMVL